MLPGCNCRFRSGDVFERAAEVDGSGAETGGGVPGDGSGERVVDLEGGGAGLVAAEQAAEDWGKALVGCGVSGEGEELAGRDVAEGDVGCGEVVEASNGRGGDDVSAEVHELG